jgi:hypothetical protein
MKKLLTVLAAAFATAAIAVTPAFAGFDDWGQQGLPAGGCAVGGHWILSPGKDVGTATLTVDGVSSTMVQASDDGANSAFHGFSTGAVSASTQASATWTGTSTKAELKLSHCTGSTTTTTGGPTTTTTTTTGGPTTTTEGPTTTTEGPTTTTEGPTTTTEGPTTTTEGPTTSTAGGPTSTTGSGGVLGGTTGGTGGTTGGTAPTGGNLPFTGLPIWLPLLAAACLLASGIMLIRRRKGEIS